jgi:hypothetical protein
VAGQMRIDFDFSRQTGPPASSLQVTVNSSDEVGVPPRTYTFGVLETTRGTLNTRIALDPSKNYDVYASTTSGTPPIPSESALTLIKPAGPVARVPLAEKALVAFGRVIARVRGDLRRRRG